MLWQVTNFPLLKCWIIFHCYTYISHLLYLFIHWWTLRLLLSWIMLQWMWEYSYLFEIFHFLWIYIPTSGIARVSILFFMMVVHPLLLEAAIPSLWYGPLVLWKGWFWAPLLPLLKSWDPRKFFGTHVV